MIEPQPASPQPRSPKKQTNWIWAAVITVVVLGLCCLLLAFGAGAYAVWKGYLTIPGLNLPTSKVPSLPAPNAPSQTIPKGTVTKITLQPFQPQSNNQYPTLQELAANWQNPAGPTTYTYSINVNANQGVLLSSGWCTTTKAILDQNYQHIKYLVDVDGQPVDASKLYQGTQSGLGQTCKDFVGLIKAWPSGSHTIKLTMRLDAKINDGSNDYAAGDYTEIYNISVP